MIRIQKIQQKGKTDWPISQQLTGSEIYRYTLEMLQVEKVGVYTGGRVIDLLDKLGNSKKIQLITGPHEQDIGHIFQGYFKVTRKPGFIITTSGPGGTNSATPIKDAHSDSDALILTIGQVPLSAIDEKEEAFQGALMIEAYKHWAKWTHRIKDVREIQSVLKTAYHVSTQGRPGPVVLELPSTITQTESTTLLPLDEVPLLPIGNGLLVKNKPPVTKSDITELAQEILKAKKPIIIAGGGIYNSGAIKELLQFSELTDIPFTTTLMLMGALPNHRLNLGLPGMHGSPESNLAIHRSDLIIYIGGRLDDRIVQDPTKFAPKSKIFWIEPYNPGINSIISERVHKIEMDAKEALTYLLEKSKRLNHGSWIEKISLWKDKYPMPDHSQRDAIERIREYVDLYEEKEPYISTGVGSHQMFVAQYWRFYPDTGKKMLLTSGGLGTMGTGTPFGVGALLADPSRSVYVFNGDGSMIMDQRSLLVAYQLRKYGLLPKDSNLKVVILRNNTLGLVCHWQDMFWNGNKISTELTLPLYYYEYMARQYEFEYFVIEHTKKDEKNKLIIKKFVKYKGNAILEVRTPADPALPMIPSSKSIDEMKLPNNMSLDPKDLALN